MVPRRTGCVHRKRRRSASSSSLVEEEEETTSLVVDRADDDEDYDEGEEDDGNCTGDTVDTPASNGSSSAQRNTSTSTSGARSGGSSRSRHSFKRVAFLQTLVLLSLHVLQQKLMGSSTSTAFAFEAASESAAADHQHHHPTTDNSNTTYPAPPPVQQQQQSNINKHMKEWDEVFLDGEAKGEQEQQQQVQDEEGEEKKYQVESYVEKRKLFTRDDLRNHPSTTSTDDDASEKNHEPVIIVATVDGTLAGLSKKTGRILWKKTKQQEEEEQQQQQQSSSSPPPSSSVLNPLISTTTTKMSSSLSSNDWKTSAVPSIDGSVYLTASTPTINTASTTTTSSTGGAGGGGGGDQVTVTTSIADLVSRSPFVDARSRIYTGSRHSTVFGIHIDSGEILQVMSTPTSKDWGEQQQQQVELENQNVVWIGRVDYSVSVHEARSGDLDVQFSTGRIMGVNDMLLGGGGTTTTTNGRETPDNTPGGGRKSSSSGGSSTSTSATAAAKNSAHFVAAASSLLSSPSSLVATPNGNLAFRNVHTGRMEWIADFAFDTPVAFAVDATTGASLTVDIIPDAVLPNGSTEYVSKEMERQMDLVYQREQQQQEEDIQDQQQPQQQHPYDEDSYSDYVHDNNDSYNDEQTIVGFLPSSGDLFAMPLGGRNRSPPSSMLYHRHPQHTTASSSSANTADAAGAPTSSSTSTVALQASRVFGRYRHSSFQQQQQKQKHSGDSPDNKQNKETFLCHPSSPYFPTCLDEDQHSATMVAKYHNQHHHDPHYHHPQHHYQGVYGGGGYHIPPPRHSSEFSHYNQHRQQHPNILLLNPYNPKRKGYHKILRILGSWLPPTIALLFVVSFELGRRKRGQQLQLQQLEQTQQQEYNALLSTTTSVDGTLGIMATATTATTSVPGSTSPCLNTSVGAVIQVFDDVILGYGAHGTVVYKGMLEGRQVAVKRMLRAYHASADREISLLIESDGHPNVVRYFLKEVRGDFVYLALELCDLSLHDLILKLKSCRSEHHHLCVGGGGSGGSASGEKENLAPLPPPPLISSATRDILFQIASGVKHLHSLRIVHRDLKPMNILLADSRKKSKQFKDKDTDDESVLDVFDSGNYIAKISDMGLGKQLVGQSSYGASLIGDASLRGNTSNGAQSSIVGTGPGSVGWQAPEVMAFRVTSDASTRSDEQQHDSCPDASPVDVAVNARTSRSADIFSLGCIFYSTLLPGCHPFGEWYEREANIMHNRPSMDALEGISLDAYDLVSSMIQRNQISRPTAAQICDHPFFWTPGQRLSFLCDFSDRIEIEGVNTDGNSCSKFSALSLEVERNASKVVGLAWDSLLHVDLISNVQRFRTYDPSSVRDLLRLIRNKHHHFDELPSDLKSFMGSSADGLVRYFESRFPRLLIHCFIICRELLPCDDPLSKKYTISPLGRSNVLKRMDVQISRITEASADESEEGKLQPKPDTPPSTPVLTEDKAAVASPSRPPHSRPETSEKMCQLQEASDMPALMPKEEVAQSETTTLVIDGVVEEPQILAPSIASEDLVIWEGSNAARMFNCRGWSRSDEEWERRVDAKLRKRDTNLVRCAEDPKFRTRLCNYWDASLGTCCPVKKKSKCIFAHGPVELRVKEGKRHRWGKLVDKNGDNNNPNHSGGEDTYGAARSIELERKQEGKWTTDKTHQQQPKGKKTNNNAGRKKKAPG